MKTKQFYFGMLMAVIAMTFAACSSDDVAQNEQGMALQFSGSYDALVAPQDIDPWGYKLLEDSLDGTLSKVSKFMLDDEAKTRAPQDNTWANMSDRNLSVMASGKVYKYSVAANGAITSSTPYYFATTSDVSVSAWYPYSASLGSFSVQANQSTAANYEKSCLLYATQTVNHSGSSNSLIFSHKTAKLIITCNFTGSKYVVNSTINSLKIDGAKITGTVSNGSITGASGSATQITAFCSRASSTSNDVTTATFECSIIPQTATLTLSIDDGGVRYRGTIPSRAYVANTIYTATVNMDATPKAIDLGLSVKWADRNIGARNRADYGEYYQWGATTEYANINQCWSATEKITVASGHDIARIKWGGKWRMPTKEEMYELWSAVSRSYPNNYSRRGMLLTRAGYSEGIFIPFAGKYYFNRGGNEILYSTSSAFLWSTSFDDDSIARNWHLWEDGHRIDDVPKRDGASVRAVCD
ncbi:MAG: fimbrillin family protein [Prevotella sp.]|nr:fimbrillin family protein [Prevotella sp.]